MLGDFYFGKKSLILLYFKNHNKEFCEVLGGEHLKNSEKICLLFSNENEKQVLDRLKKLNVIVYCQPTQLPISSLKLTKGDAVFKNISTSNANVIRNLGIFVTV